MLVVQGRSESDNGIRDFVSTVRCSLLASGVFMYLLFLSVAGEVAGEEDPGSSVTSCCSRWWCSFFVGVCCLSFCGSGGCCVVSGVGATIAVWLGRMHVCFQP